MNLPKHEIGRRRPVWEALADLFLDTELQDCHYRFIATQIMGSGYTFAEIQHILWEEVFPAVEYNLRNPAGVWEGFPIDWLEKRILAPDEKQVEKQSAVEQPDIARAISDALVKVCRFLPRDFIGEGVS